MELLCKIQRLFEKISLYLMIVSSRQVWVISRPQVRQVSPQVPQVYQASMYCRGGPLHSSWVQRLLFAAWTTLPWNINFFKKNNETMKGVGSNYSHTLAQKVQLSRFQEHALNVCWNLIYNVNAIAGFIQGFQTNLPVQNLDQGHIYHKN